MSSNQRSICFHTQPPSSTLYFAYGSNMSVAQMARRCPGSIFKGPAILDSFQWQINQRGVANVVKLDGNHLVEGLLYIVTTEDESALDRNEGVSKGFYQRHLATVSFQPHRQYTDFKTTRLALLLKQWREEMGDCVCNDRASRRSPWTKVRALVYISDDYTSDGEIRDEYIPRIQDAVNDAVHLGVSKPFVNKYIVPFLDTEEIFHLSANISISNHKQVQKRLAETGLAPMAQSAVVQKAKSQDNCVMQEAGCNTTESDGTEQEVPHSKPQNIGSASAYKTDLSKLNKENLIKSNNNLYAFPAEMFEVVQKVSRPAYEFSDYYVIAERRMGSETTVSIVVNAQQPHLANEAAMKEFQKIIETEGKSAEISCEAPDLVVVKEGSLGELKWKLEGGQYLHLKCEKSGERPWLIVRVESRPFLECW